MSEQFTPPTTPTPTGAPSDDSTSAPTCSGGGGSAGCSGISQSAKPWKRLCRICSAEFLFVKGKVILRPVWVACAFAACDYWIHAECLGFIGPGIFPDYYCREHWLYVRKGRSLKGVVEEPSLDSGEPVPEDHP